MIGPTYYYDVIDLVIVAKSATVPLGNKHKISDVIITIKPQILNNGAFLEPGT